MNRYRGNVEAVRNLIRETEVHRDVYIDEEVFQLEMERLWARGVDATLVMAGPPRSCSPAPSTPTTT